MLKAWGNSDARCHFIQGFAPHDKLLLPYTKGTDREKWMAAVEVHIRDNSGGGDV